MFSIVGSSSLSLRFVLSQGYCVLKNVSTYTYMYDNQGGGGGTHTHTQKGFKSSGFSATEKNSVFITTVNCYLRVHFF